MDAILTFKYLNLNYAFLFGNKENKVLFGAGIRIRMVANMDTSTCASLYQQPVTWIFTRLILSDSVL